MGWEDGETPGEVQAGSSATFLRHSLALEVLETVLKDAAVSATCKEKQRKSSSEHVLT